MRKILFLLLMLFLLAGCQQKHTELPSVYELPNFGDPETDVFFQKNKLKEYGIKGKLVASVLVKETPQLVLFDTETQKIITLTTEGEWNRAPAFSPDGKKVYFASRRQGRNYIMMIDIDSHEETTLTAEDVDRYDPLPISEDRLVYNVFPPGENFYLAVLDLKSGEETTPTFTTSTVAHNIALRAAYPAYAESAGLLYFVNDLAVDGKPRPLNIWAADLTKGTAFQITHNTTVTLYNIGGMQIYSPQYSDLRVTSKGELLYSLRTFKSNPHTGQPYFAGTEVHLYDPQTGSDSTITTARTSLLGAVEANENYVFIVDLERRELIGVNKENSEDRFVFISKTPFIGDIDFFADQ